MTDLATTREVDDLRFDTDAAIDRLRHEVLDNYRDLANEVNELRNEVADLVIRARATDDELVRLSEQDVTLIEHVTTAAKHLAALASQVKP